jgi:hypothetical protein
MLKCKLEKTSAEWLKVGPWREANQSIIDISELIFDDFVIIFMTNRLHKDIDVFFTGEFAITNHVEKRTPDQRT